MLQHQLQKNCFRDPLARLSNASLIRQSFAVTCTHQRIEAPALDKVIYELFGFVPHFSKYTAPQSMSASVLEGVDCEISTISFQGNWGPTVLQCLNKVLHLLNVHQTSDLPLDKSNSVPMGWFKLGSLCNFSSERCRWIGIPTQTVYKRGNQLWKESDEKKGAVHFF